MRKRQFSIYKIFMRNLVEESRDNYKMKFKDCYLELDKRTDELVKTLEHKNNL